MQLTVLFRKRWLWLYLPILLTCAALLWLSYAVWLPLPPKSLVMAGGLPTGSYTDMAVRYRDLLETRGVEVTTVTTQGAGEPLERLISPKRDVDTSFAQGLLAKPDMPQVIALAAVERSPIWIFTRTLGVKQLAQLKGARIAYSDTGQSATEIVALLLQHARLTQPDIKLTNTLSNEAAALALLSGKVDAIILLASGQSDVVRQLTRDSSVTLLGIDRVTSLVARESRLKPFVLPQGAIELRGDIPPRDLTMVSANLHLLVHSDMHPALQRALLDTGREIHEMPSFLQRQGEFPNSREMDFAASPVAIQLANGERPWLERLLPYWWAQLAELLIYAVFPILAVTLLVLAWIPNLFNWKINAILQNFYGELKFLETDIEPTASSRPIEIKRLLQRLDTIEAKVTTLDLPNSHANRWYTLREHLARARAKLLDMRAR